MTEDDENSDMPELLPAEKAGNSSNAMVAHVWAEISTHSGPLPPPQVMADYERLTPGAADRILTMAEKQAAHRRELEKEVVTGNLRAAQHNRTAATILGLAGFAYAAYAAKVGQSAAGAAVVITEIAAVIGTFLYGQKSKKEERLRKAELQAEIRAEAKKKKSDTSDKQ